MTKQTKDSQERDNEEVLILAGIGTVFGIILSWASRRIVKSYLR